MAYDGDISNYSSPRVPITPETQQVLLRAMALIQRGWTSKVLALDHHGLACLPYDEYATQFCTLGALRLAVREASRIKPTWLDRLLRADPRYDGVKECEIGLVVEHIVSRHLPTSSIPDLSNAARIAMWNDRADRTKTDVLCHLAACAGISTPAYA